MEKQPFKEHKIGKNSTIRHYDNKIKKEDLPWVRNPEDMTIEPLSNNDWLFQIDNELPIPIDKNIFIPKEIYHRIIKGVTELNLKVTKI